MKRKKNRFKIKPQFLLVTLLVVILVIIFSSFQFYKKASLERISKIGTQTKSVIYPTLYSDKHITKNAKATNPKFEKSIVFHGQALTANVSSSLLKSRSYLSSGGKIENGTWLWTPLLEITPEYRETILAAAEKNGLKNIYLSLDSYLDIFVMDEGPAKEAQKAIFTQALLDFIIAAKKHNLTVDAEGGWRNWAEPGNLYKPFALLDYVINFNHTQPEKLRGFQYDVEPYLLAEYQKNKKVVLHNFVSLIDETILKLQESGLEFTVVIPEFYDGTNNETPAFYYGGRLGFTFDHLLSIMENRPGSKIIVMSYRNYSKGEDGSIAISQDEIIRANKYETKIILAQETGEVEPSYVTFHKTSKNYLKRELSLLKKAFENDRSYNGVAIHYLNAYIDLR